MIELGLYLTYALLGVTVLAILVFAVLRTISNLASAKTALIGIVGLLIVWGISYAISGTSDAAQYEEVSEGTVKRVGAGLITLYLLGSITILSIIYSQISRLIK